MPEAVTALVVDVEGMMGVLDGRDAMAAERKFRDQTLDECGLAGVLESRNTNDPVIHGRKSDTICSPKVRSSGVLMLKKGS
jgi:hypothetical protein